MYINKIGMEEAKITVLGPLLFTGKRMTIPYYLV